MTVILGDLFMFTQVDDKTGRTLTVRDSAINSDEELRAFLTNHLPLAAGRGERSSTMIQKGSRSAWPRFCTSWIGLAARSKSWRGKTSRATTYLNHDIIYLGPLVRLGVTRTATYEYRSRYRYSAEGLKIVDVSTGKAFVPEGSLAGQHLDYALAAKFIGPTGNHIMIVTAACAKRWARADRAYAHLGCRTGRYRKATHPEARQSDSFEALLTVTGFKQTNLAAEVIAVDALLAPASRSQTSTLK